MIDRTNFDALVDDDGTNTTGSPWNKSVVATVLLDPIDDAIEEAAGSGGATLPINLTTDATGTLQAGQEPSHSGDVSNAAGSLVLAIGAAKVTNAMLAGSIAATKLVKTDLQLTPSQIPSTGVTLTDAASVTLNPLSQASVYRLFANGDRTILAPTPAPVGDGQKIVIAHVATGGARTLSLTTGVNGFRFGTDIPALTPTVSGKTDYIGAIYTNTDMRWDIVAYSKGF